MDLRISLRSSEDDKKSRLRSSEDDENKKRSFAIAHRRAPARLSLGVKLPFSGVLALAPKRKKTILADGLLLVGAERFELPTLSV